VGKKEKVWEHETGLQNESRACMMTLLLAGLNQSLKFYKEPICQAYAEPPVSIKNRKAFKRYFLTCLF